MTLQFFGTGGAIHTRRLTNTSFVVRQGSSTVLVDASGSPVHDLLNAGVDPPALGALVLTHAHTDHVYAFPSLIHNLWLMGRSKPLDVITNQETQEIATQLCNTLGLFSKSGLFEIGWYVGQDIVHDVGVNDSSKLTVRLFPVQHSVATSGIVFQAGSTKVVYSCDTSPIDRVEEEARGADALIHEASGLQDRSETLNGKGHSTGQQAGKAAQRAGVGRLYLCHLDPRGKEQPEDIVSEAAAEFTGETVWPERYIEYEV